MVTIKEEMCNRLITITEATLQTSLPILPHWIIFCLDNSSLEIPKEDLYLERDF